MVKAIRILGLVMLLLICAPAVAWAAPTVLINGHSLEMEVSPQIIQDRVMVPISSIFGELGAEVTWMDETKTILAKKDKTLLVIQIGKTNAIINGKTQTLDSPPVIVDGRTLVPLSFVATALDAKVAWDGPTETVSIMLKKAPVKDWSLTPSDIFKQVEPSVFTVVTFTSDLEFWGYGDGLVVRDGKIMTNFALIDGAAWACIELPDKSILVSREVGGYSKEQDVAILKFPKRDVLKPAILGDSDLLTTGSRIYFIGCPFGLEKTMADGLVSSARRKVDDMNLMQISAPMDFSTMGGFLFNTRGELVGLNFADSEYIEAQELNFVTPINDIKSLIESDTFVPMGSIEGYYALYGI
ncbi:MAG: stalk domain-containing protein [Syntrophomonadaceae bacterium]